jgi:O-antigen ligase
MAVRENLIEKSLKLIIFIGSFLALLIPFIVVSESYFPYIIQKTLILRIIIEAVFFCYLVLALWKPEYRPRKSLLLWSVVAFFAVMVLTTLTSQSLFRSWWGNWERMFGTFNYLHYLIWFIVLSSVLKKVKDWSRLLNFTLLVSLIISLYSFSQRLGLSFTFQAGLERVNGTIGNASYLATYMLLHLFIALFFVIEKPGLKWKFYYLFILLADFLTLILTGTRGAHLALFLSLPILIFFVLKFKLTGQRVSRAILIISVVLILALGGIFAFKSSNFIKNNYWLKRLTNYSFSDNTIKTRLMSWNWGLKGFRDNLIFGVGPENYLIPFDYYFEPEFYNYTGDEIWFDRAHNTLVDMASTMGIFGLLSYLFIFIVAMFYLFEFKKRQTINPLTFSILFLLFFSYFFQNIFVFDSLNSLIIFYLLLAYLNFIKNQSEPVKQARFKGISPIITGPLAVIIFIFFFFNWNLPEIKVNKLIYEGYVAKAYADYPAMVLAYKKAYPLTYNKVDEAILLSSSLNEFVYNQDISSQTKIEDLQLAVSWLDRAIELEPKNMFLYYLQAKNYSNLAELAREVKYIEKGIEFAKEASSLSPGRVRPFWLLAQLYYFGSMPEVALNYLDQAIAMNPRLKESYYYKANILKLQGQTAEYFEQMDKLLDLDYQFDENQSLSLISHYEATGDSRRLYELYNGLTYLNPKSSDYWRQAIYYAILNNNDKAVEILNNRVKKNIPNFIYESQN